MKDQIYPCLWFEGQAKDAAGFYCTLFKDSKITNENSIVVTIEISGQKFMCLNGGPMFKINPSVSFYVVCETEEEVDDVWKKLSEDGKIMMAIDKYDWSEKYGWVQDKFGVSWQISLGKLEDTGQKITPTLMFIGDQAGKAESAINFYTSVFKDSGVAGILKYGENENDKEGLVKHAQFNLGKNVFMIIESSAGHEFKMNEAISFVVECDTQEEIDYYWEKLTSDGGEESMCGWLKDKYGVSWQIVPSVLSELMSDPERSKRVTDAFLKMKKFDIEKILRA